MSGPESTGKSALTSHLAGVFGVPYAQEYARIYLEKNGPSYDFDLLLQLSREHKDYQWSCVPASAPVGIFDTDLINYKIWCEVVYGRCHDEIIRRMNEETNHVYLLCYPDLPWTFDPLRENPNNRDELFALHVQAIEQLGRPYHIIRGVDGARRVAAERAVRDIIAQY